MASAHPAKGKRWRTPLASPRGTMYKHSMKSKVIAIRVTAEEHRRFHAEADRLGITVTELVLSRTLGE